jgi:bla regulator protein BlaR1
MKDFTVSVSRYAPDVLNRIIGVIWGAGVVLLTIVTVWHNYKIHFLKKSVCVLKNKKIEQLFYQCKEDMGIRHNIILGESDFIETPMLFSFIKTYIVLPKQLRASLTDDEVRYILLHELSHYKNKDILMNYILCFFQIIYWFNPIVWFAFGVMRTDREIVCDISVLKKLHQDYYIAYGRTIINFADKMAGSSALMVTADMIGSKYQIKKRIEKISVYTKESRVLSIKSASIFISVCLMMTTQVFAFSSIAYPNATYVFKNKNVVYEDLSEYFEGFEGCFVLYDSAKDCYTIYNKTQSTLRVSPDSTYKIYSALFGLEAGIIQDEKSGMKWEGRRYEYENWNKDQELAGAMRDSVNWYFQNIDQQVGLINLGQYFNKINYGNKDLTAGLQNYWLESSLKISAIEQVQLLKNLYNYEMDFEKRNIDIVKNVMKLSEAEGAILSGKTGSGVVNGKDKKGWFVGYVEKDGETHFFAVYIQDQEKAAGSTAAKIALNLLEEKNIY